jgi:MFS family permease
MNLGCGGIMSDPDNGEQRRLREIENHLKKHLKEELDRRFDVLWSKIRKDNLSYFLGASGVAFAVLGITFLATWEVQTWRWWLGLVLAFLGAVLLGVGGRFSYSATVTRLREAEEHKKSDTEQLKRIEDKLDAIKAGQDKHLKESKLELWSSILLALAGIGVSFLGIGTGLWVASKTLPEVHGVATIYVWSGAALALGSAFIWALLGVFRASVTRKERPEDSSMCTLFALGLLEAFLASATDKEKSEKSSIGSTGENVPDVPGAQRKE